MNFKISYKYILTIVCIIAITAIAIFCKPKEMVYQYNEGLVFGTSYHITYQWNADLQDEITKTLQEVDNSLSPFNKNSIITKINQNEPVEIDSHFEKVFSLAQQISKETDGNFDITVAPLVNAWGFGFKNGTHPNKQQIDSLKRFIGYEKVELKGKQIIKQYAETMLDCSAIAKGYGVDAVAEMLKKKGIENFMVEIGGEVVTNGINNKKQAWKIGITKPVDDSLAINGETLEIIEVKNSAMATSGNYRNFYVVDGKKFAHTIDPKTGSPVQHSLLSATVLAESCTIADAYATSFMVMGVENAKKILKKHPELTAYLIYSNSRGEMEMLKICGNNIQIVYND